VSYSIHTLLIENNRFAERSYKNKDGDAKSSYGKKNEFIKVEFFNNATIASFAVGDFVEITGYLSGQEWTPPDGKTKIIQKNAGVYIKHADLDAERPSKKGKMPIESLSSTDELTENRQVFKAPDPDQSDYESDLPF
jgi:hypothetical protein